MKFQGAVILCNNGRPQDTTRLEIIIYHEIFPHKIVGIQIYSLNFEPYNSTTYYNKQHHCKCKYCHCYKVVMYGGGFYNKTSYTTISKKETLAIGLLKLCYIFNSDGTDCYL